MKYLKTFALIAGITALTACEDIASPEALDVSAKKARSATTLVEAPIDAVAEGSRVGDLEVVGTAEPADVPKATIRQSADAPALMTYSTCFKAIQGQGNTFVVYYQDPWTDKGTIGDWFMKLDVPRDAQLILPSGALAAPGDTVEITVEIDRSLFFVQFGPHGSQFAGKQPAKLSFNLEFAEFGDGNPSAAAVWYQPTSGEQWTLRETTVDLKRNKAVIDLYHFSNYAMAF